MSIRTMRVTTVLMSTILVSILIGIATLGSAQTILNRREGPSGGFMTDLEFDPATGKAFALAENRPYVSNDSGQTWVKLDGGLGSDSFNDIEIVGNTIYFLAGFDLYISTDGGLSFTKRNTDNTLSFANRIKRIPTDSRLVALSSSQLYFSTNNGMTWSSGANGSFNDEYLIVNNLGQIFTINSSTNLPIRSIDGGVSFANPGNTGVTAPVFSLASNSDLSAIFCVSSTGLLTSTNASSWTSIKGGSITDATISDGTNPGLIAFSKDGLGMYFIDNVNKKLHFKGSSEANGLWTAAVAFPGTSQRVYNASVLNYATPVTSVALFGTLGGCFRTSTGGGTIFESNIGISEVRSQKIISLFNGDLVLSAVTVGLLHSANNGDSWTKVNAPISEVSELFITSSSDIVYALGSSNQTLYRSVDKGINWTMVPFPAGVTGFRWARWAADDRIFALSTDNTSVYYSNNGGSNWTATNISISGLPGSFSYVQQTFLMVTPSRLVAQLFNFDTSEYEFWRIDFTVGAGLTISGAATKIENLLPFSNINELWTANGNLYAYNRSSTPDQLSVSTDGGATWGTPLNSPSSSGDFFVTNNGYIFIVSDSDEKIYLSRDNGSTYPVEIPAPSTLETFRINDITLGPTGHAYLAVDRDHVYRTNITTITPEPPTNLTEIGKSATAVAIKWDDNSDFEKEYTIERSTNGVDFTSVGQYNAGDVCSSPSQQGYFVIQNLTPSTSYQFRVKARNDAGSSSGVTVNVTTLASTTPNIPDNRSWDAVNSGESGNAIVTPAKIVGIKHLDGGKYSVSDVSLGVVSGSTILPDMFFESGGQTVLVTENGFSRIKPNGNGVWNGTNILTLKWRECDNDEFETITYTLRSDDPVPSAPSGVRALVLDDTRIEVNWVQGYFEKEYVIERSSTSPSSGFTTLTTVQYPTVQFIDNGPFTSGTTYHYRIKSRNADLVPEESPYSTVSSVLFQQPNFIISNTAVSNFLAITVGSYWADFDNDGFDDLMTLEYDFSTERGVPTIFRNLGTGDFEKRLVSIDPEQYIIASVADVNNDGFADLAFGIENTNRFDIYYGDGDFTFTKLTDLQKGDIAVVNDAVASSSVADFNNDGLLDFILLMDNGGGVLLFKQNLDGSFTKVAGGEIASDIEEYLSAGWADYDNDGDVDVVLGSSLGSGPCRLYRNNGDETFSLTTGNGFDATSAPAVAWGDYNNDGFLDLYAGNTTQNVLYKNNGNGTFTKNNSTSISEAYIGIAANWLDINNDGLLDLITPRFFGTATRMFINTSTISATSFTKITSEKLCDPEVLRYGIGVNDYDRNGFVDVFMPAAYFPPSGNDVVSSSAAHLFANNNSSGSWSLIKLQGVQSNKNGIGARIIVTAEGKDYIREVASSTSLVSKNSTTMHFGLGSATTISNIQVKWPSGIIQNYPNPAINTFLTIPEDNSGPVIASLVPANGSTGISVTTTLQVNFSETTIGVAGKNIVVTGSGDASPTATIAVTSGTKTGNTWTFTLPAGLTQVKSYSVQIDPGSFTDIYSNEITSIPVWSFTTEADTEPPSITFTAPTTLDKGFGTQLLSAQATDNNNVTSVKMFHRPIGGAAFSELSGVKGTGDTWDLTIQESFFDATGLEYYLESTDAFSNTARSPVGSTFHRTYLRSIADVQIPDVAIGVGGRLSDWKVLAIPYELTNNGISSIFDELGNKTNKVDYRILTYKDASSWDEFPSSTLSVIVRGKGYFVNFKDQTAITIGANLTPPNNSRSNLFSLNLKQGWNMIGNPYLTPISWGNVAAFNGLTGQASELLIYNGTDYVVSTSELQPFTGGFVFVASDISNVSIPFLGQTSPGGRVREDFGDGDWILPLTIRQENKENTFGGIGMHQKASYSYDDFDRINAPRFFKFSEINFNHPEHFAKTFSRDVVPAREEYTWEFTVDSNLGGTASIHWDNEGFGQNTKELYLFDENLQKLIDMRDLSNYSFDPEQSNKFKVYFGSDLKEKIQPDKVLLGAAYPNPSSGMTTIPFNLPASSGLFQVKLEVYDMMGRKVSVLQDGRLPSGFYEMQWNSESQQLNNGLYTYRLAVAGEGMSEVFSNKLILKK